MPRPGLIPARNHWCLHNDKLAQEFDGILNLTQTFPGCRKAPEGAVFYAPLFANLNELVGGYAYNYERQLEAVYERTPNQWRIAAEDVPRFESGRLLMEPAGTNKCENWNAAPDAGLTNVLKIGDAAATITRVNDADALAAAGLSELVPESLVLCLDTTGASTSAAMRFGGTVGNTNDHTMSAWCRKVSGDGSVDLRLSGGEGATEFTNTSYERVSGLATPEATSRQFQIQADPNVIAYVILNQLEESPVLTTPIITRGASASRSRDELTYFGVNEFFDQSIGIVVLDWVPNFDSAQIVPLEQEGMINIGSPLTGLLYHDINLKTYDGTANSSVPLPNFTRGQLVRSLGRWQAGDLDGGLWWDGAWYWDLSPQGYDGAFATDGNLRIMAGLKYPAHVMNATIYGINPDPPGDRTWIEDNLTP